MNIFSFMRNGSAPILPRPIALLFAAAGIMVLSACGDESGGPQCDSLQSYYDDCCDICGASDSYCSSDFNVSDDSEASCEAELNTVDTSECYCDIF